MEISVSDLNPRLSELVIYGKTYTLDKFSLKHEVWAAEHYATEQDGIINLSNLLTNMETIRLFPFLYRLILNKESFPTYEKFLDTVNKEFNKDRFDFTNRMFKALLETFGASRPMLSKAEKEVLAEKK